MQTFDPVIALLGGPKVLGARPRSAGDYVALVRAGLPFGAFEAAVRALELTEDEALDALHVARRTWARRKASRARLPAAESERVLRLVRVGAAARETLGDSAKALRWLRAPHRALGGVAPLSLLDTDVGTQSVLDSLAHIEHGVFA